MKQEAVIHHYCPLNYPQVLIQFPLENTVLYPFLCLRDTIKRFPTSPTFIQFSYFKQMSQVITTYANRNGFRLLCVSEQDPELVCANIWLVAVWELQVCCVQSSTLKLRTCSRFVQNVLGVRLLGSPQTNSVHTHQQFYAVYFIYHSINQWTIFFHGIYMFPLYIFQAKSLILHLQTSPRPLLF